jgi:hypothetical protein
LRAPGRRAYRLRVVDDERKATREKFEQYAALATRDFDRFVATIAAGALGLSITFLHDIAPAPLQHAGRLQLSWVLLTGSLLFSMVSFLTSDQAHRALIKQIDDEIKLGELLEGRWGWATHALNIGAAVALIGGAVFLSYFALGNS